MLGGTTDHWSVSLPSGYSFSGSLTGPIIVGEPEDTNSKNNISAFTTNGHFTWESDIGAPATTALSTVTMTSAGTDPAGKTFDLILTDAGDDPVPDLGSTFGLLCLALAAVFGASRLRSIRFALRERDKPTQGVVANTHVIICSAGPLASSTKGSGNQLRAKLREFSLRGDSARLARALPHPAPSPHFPVWCARSRSRSH